MRTYTIELRADFGDDAAAKERYEQLLAIVRQEARTLLASASLLSGKRKPQIAIQCGDMFEGNSDIELGDGE